MKCNQSRQWFELVSSCPIPTTITITPWAHEISVIELSCEKCLTYELLLFCPFSHQYLFDGITFQYFQELMIFLLSKRNDISGSYTSLLSVISIFPPLLVSMVYFSIPNSIPISWMYIIIACIRVPSWFSFLSNCFISSFYIMGSKFFLWFCECVAFLTFLTLIVEWLQWNKKIAIVIGCLTGRCLFWSSPLLGFFLLLWISLSISLSILWWSLWFIGYFSEFLTFDYYYYYYLLL